MMPTADQVAAYLGSPADTALLLQANEHLPIVTAQVNAYTRGNGFTDGQPGDDLAAVIVSACARSLDNPARLAGLTVGSLSYRYATVDGWTLPELAILHTYRRRAA